jgi:hypothetical protein
MEPLHVAHLIVLGMWLGVVITEALFEFAASDAESLRAAARFHYRVDKFGELPILFAVLVTGTSAGGALLAIDAPALHQDCGVAGRSGGQLHLYAMGVPAAANRGREAATGIPAPNLDSGGRRRGLRDSRSLSRVGLFPTLRGVSLVRAARRDVTLKLQS